VTTARRERRCSANSPTLAPSASTSPTTPGHPASPPPAISHASTTTCAIKLCSASSIVSHPAKNPRIASNGARTGQNALSVASALKTPKPKSSQVT
jgi:hypothetical protein